MDTHRNSNFYLALKLQNSVISNIRDFAFVISKSIRDIVADFELKVSNNVHKFLKNIRINHETKVFKKNISFYP